MKILIVSDTHGRNENLEKVMNREKPLDLFIHLGDIGNYEDYIEALAECDTFLIAGNNDYFSCLDGEKEVDIGGYKTLLTHGHPYYVTVNADFIKKEARGRDMDIVMFGHTHRPLIDIDEDLVTLNPGSISYPRQDDKKCSYIIMNIDKDGKAEYCLKYV